MRYFNDHSPMDHRSWPGSWVCDLLFQWPRPCRRDQFWQERRNPHNSADYERAFNLGYRITTYRFILNVRIKNNGYVLQNVGEKDTYIPLDTAFIEELQEAGELPTPLPEYSLSFFDYLFGYSLWIVVGIILAIPLGKWMLGGGLSSLMYRSDPPEETASATHPTLEKGKCQTR